jgi:hypothetical protein
MLSSWLLQHYGAVVGSLSEDGTPFYDFGLASVTPWYDSTGKIGYYEFSGDLRSCSHPPLTLYDSKGREALTIPNQLFDPRKKKMIEDLKKVHQKRKELLKGYTQSKAIFIPRFIDNT